MPRMMYVNDDGSCVPFGNTSEMIDAIKRDAKPKLPRVTMMKELQIQGVIAHAIKERGGSLYEDNGEVMRGHISSILCILGLERE